MLSRSHEFKLIIHMLLFLENPLLEGREEQEAGADIEHTLAEVSVLASHTFMLPVGNIYIYITSCCFRQL